MKRSLPPSDLQLLNTGLAHINLKLNEVFHKECPYSLSCYYINNPDGSLRWLWPAGNRRAAFLRFYYTGTMRARLMAWGLQLLVWLGLSKLIASGHSELFINETGLDLTERYKDWALFTGTVGQTRKLLIWYRQCTASYFCKLPLTDLAETNMHNEATALRELSATCIQKPATCVLNTQVMIQSDLYQDQNWLIPVSIEALPAPALQEWLSHGLELHIVKTTNWWKSAHRKLEYLNHREDQRYNPVLMDRLQQLLSNFSGEHPVMTAPAHGDFTPWNIRYKDHAIAAVDWELYDGNRPALYDFFHFIYQDSILVRRLDFKAIRHQIDQILMQPEWHGFLRENNIDVAVAEQLYLIHTITFYLDLYMRQEHWHLQVHWLLQIWNEALGYWLGETGIYNHRQLVLQDVSHYLQHKSYVALKLHEADIKDLPVSSDLDLVMQRTDAIDLCRWIRRHCSVRKATIQKQSFMNRIGLILSDGSFLHIDCLWQIKRKQQTFMQPAELMEYSMQNESGTKVPHPLAEFKYIWLFYLLNGKGLPEKYLNRYYESPAYSKMAGILIRQYELPCTTSTFPQYDATTHEIITKALTKEADNKGFNLWSNRLNYLADTLRGLWPRKGFVATFSGVDGAGKSTIIENIAAAIDKELRMPVVILRHRPSILPILSAWRYGKQAAEQRSVARLPRQGQEIAGLRSLLRFLYYYTDYLLGQFYVQIRYVYRGYAVLYDRYYFDFISDSKRSNLIVPQWLSMRLYGFLLKPDFNYFLFAPPSVILQRKQELNSQTIITLTDQYLHLFARLRTSDARHTYDSICNIDLNHTVRHIFENFKQQRLCAAL